MLGPTPFLHEGGFQATRKTQLAIAAASFARTHTLTIRHKVRRPYAHAHARPISKKWPAKIGPAVPATPALPMYLLYFEDIPNLVSCAFSTIPIFPPFNSQFFKFTCLCSFFRCFAVLHSSRLAGALLLWFPGQQEISC